MQGSASAHLFLDSAIPPRTLGLVVLRGPNIALISPTDGSAGQSPSWTQVAGSRADYGRNREPIPIDVARVKCIEQPCTTCFHFTCYTVKVRVLMTTSYDPSWQSCRPPSSVSFRRHHLPYQLLVARPRPVQPYALLAVLFSPRAGPEQH